MLEDLKKQLKSLKLSDKLLGTLPSEQLHQLKIFLDDLMPSFELKVKTVKKRASKKRKAGKRKSTAKHKVSSKKKATSKKRVSKRKPAKRKITARKKK